MAQLTLENLVLEENRLEEKLKRSKKKPTLKNATKIFTDAGYGWARNLNKPVKRGRVAWKIGRGKFHIKEIEIPAIKGLVNYGNIFELLAIKFALEVTRAKNVLVITDSKIAMAWVERRHNDLGRFSKVHFEIKEKIDEAKKKFDSFHIKWAPRNSNMVGVWLEEQFGK